MKRYFVGVTIWSDISRIYSENPLAVTNDVSDCERLIWIELNHSRYSWLMLADIYLGFPNIN